VACSGGADSSALLIALHRVAPEFGLTLAAAHLHHGLRGRDADRDLSFVRELCRRLDVPLHAARMDGRARMRAHGWSGQDGLRRLRRAFLMRAARRCEAAAIATAHTADDQLETLLLRLARGTGFAGLGAMSARRGIWIRPLLDAARAEIEADLRAARESWRNDGSNADLRYARNRVRHEVVPALLRVHHDPLDLAARGALAKRVSATLRETRAAHRWLEQQAAAALDEALSGKPMEGIAIDCARLATFPAPVRRLALRRAWRLMETGQGLTGPVLDRLESLVPRRGAGRLNLPARWTADRTGSSLRIVPERFGIEGPTPQAEARAWVRVPGRNQLGDIGLRSSWVAGSSARRGLGAGGDGEFFAASHLKGRLELRSGRTDEWFVPFGRQRPQPLGDFLKRLGLPRVSHTRRLVLADRQGILWVVGVRRSARAPITPGTRKALWIRART